MRAVSDGLPLEVGVRAGSAEVAGTASGILARPHRAVVGRSVAAARG